MNNENNDNERIINITELQAITFKHLTRDIFDEKDIQNEKDD